MKRRTDSSRLAGGTCSAGQCPHTRNSFAGFWPAHQPCLLATALQQAGVDRTAWRGILRTPSPFQSRSPSGSTASELLSNLSFYTAE